MVESVAPWIYGASALIAAVLFVLTVRAPAFSPMRIGLLIYLSGTAWWAIVDVVRWAAGPSSVSMVEAWTMPAAALVVAGVRFGAHAAASADWKASSANIVGFSIHPFLVLVVAAIPALWRYVGVEASDGSVAYGPIFWAHAVVTYGLFVLATIVIFRGRHTNQALTRKWAPAVASVWLILVAASVLTIWNIGVKGMDLMPPGFALAAFVIWRVLALTDLKAAARIARSQVFEELGDAVIVIGNNGHILDANKAALKLVGAPDPLSAYIDKSLWQTWPCIADASSRSGEHDLTVAGVDVVMDVTISPLSQANGVPSGQAVVLRNVTAAVLQRRELAQLRAELSEMVVRDANTGLHNRRYAEQTLPQTLARCVAKRVPMSVAIIDVDHFKVVNDTHGHPVGDRVLRELARAMLDEVPSSMLARIGGEEFLVLLPGLSNDQAVAHTERLRAACARATVSTREGAVHVTVSAGVATTRDGKSSVDALMEAADAALYRAKGDGRNRTCSGGDVNAVAPADA